MTKFHDEPFDEVTLTKLELFRRYIREWLPVFLQDRSGGTSQINIFDLFAGRGKDSNGVDGSALIIVKEIRKSCETFGEQRSRVPVQIVFNDIKRKHIQDLRRFVDDVKCPQSCCSFKYSSLDFEKALALHLSELRKQHSANLVIMDQYGFKLITPEITKKLACCGRTDIMFFISSSFIRRFSNQQRIVEPSRVREADFNLVHRFICDTYRDKLKDVQYYLAPFSLKKGNNIHGVIFGTEHPLGLEKFLRVGWALDGITGEANYNIDQDLSRDGQQTLWPEHSVPRKIDLFKRQLQSVLRERPRDNRELYLFCLTCGFPGKKAKEIVSEMVKDGCVEVEPLNPEDTTRKSGFYLSYNAYKEAPKVRYRMRDCK